MMRSGYVRFTLNYNFDFNALQKWLVMLLK